MKPAHERNQECLPPKKRDLPVNNNSSSSSNNNSGSTGGGGVGPTATAAGGGEEATSTQNTAASTDVQSGAASGEWLRAQQQALHCGLEAAAADGVSGLPPDQYSMLYKVALPSVSYSPTSLHPVLSHISPAYTVPSPLLQHAGLSYPPLGYAQIPHSSLQFVGSPYAAVPYAVPPGFVPNPLISPQSAIPQPHAVPHLVPYPSVIQEGVVSSPPQTQVPAHAYAKVAGGGIPLVLSSEQAAAAAAQQQQLGAVGVLTATELSPRGVPVFYHPARALSASREALEQERERERDRERDRGRELNGGEREQPARDVLQDSAHMLRNARLLPATEAQQLERGFKSRRSDERASPGQRSTPDTDLEVQQVVGCLASPIQAGSRKEASHIPLNLSQSSQRSRDAHGEGRTVYVPPPVAMSADPRAPAQAQQAVPAQPGHHAVILANGQPVLIPLEYHRHAQPQQSPNPYPGQPNDATSATSQSPYSKAAEHPAASCLSERTGALELHQPPPPAQAQAQVLPTATAIALAPAPVPVPVPSQALAPQAPVPGAGPSHFMKGAIIQLATGELKRVEDLQTQDFVRSAEVSGGLKIDSSMVVDVRASQQRPGLVALHFSVGEQQSKVTIDVPPEHPFFVFGQGWSSCSPERTAQLYGLACHHLQVGDVCVSIALQQPPAAQPKAQPQQPQQHHHHHQQQQQQQQQHHHQQQQQQQMMHARTSTKSNSTSGALVQPMGPPAPQHTRPHSQSHFRMDRVQRERDRERERERERDRDRERERGEKDEVVHVGSLGHGEATPRPNRTSAEHPRSLSSYYLHTEGHSRHEAGGGGGGGGGGSSGGGLALTSSSAAQRRWSAPGSQRYAVKSEDGRMVVPGLPGPSRPSFIPQEVKLSIEGRSNAGK